MDEKKALLIRAYDKVEKGDFDGAYRLFQKVETFGADVQLLNDMAVVSYQMDRFEVAIAAFRRAIEQEGGSRVAENLVDIVEAQRRTINDLTAKRLEDTGISLDSRNLWFENSAESLHRRALEISDSHWIQAVVDSSEMEPIDGLMLPGFVSAELQRTYVGSSGRQALGEAANFVRVVLDYARRAELPLCDSKFRICDFGCGWGRYTRFMLKYAHPDNIFGIDVSGMMLEKCRKIFGMCNFLKIDSFPPSPIRDDFFDLVFGYSVFSHLSRECSDAWIAEFSRIVRPGGLVIMTTQGRTFIDFCHKIRESGDRSNAWFECLARSFVDTDEAYRQYDSGVFLHASTTVLNGYGESMIPLDYVIRNWLDKFDLVDFIDDRSFLPQALFVLRRKSDKDGDPVGTSTRG